MINNQNRRSSLIRKYIKKFNTSNIFFIYYNFIYFFCYLINYSNRTRAIFYCKKSEGWRGATFCEMREFSNIETFSITDQNVLHGECFRILSA
jgi:hypothetical protein